MNPSQRAAWFALDLGPLWRSHPEPDSDQRIESLPAVTPLPAAVDPKPFKQGSDPPEDRAHGLAAHWQELVVAVEACRACALGATRQRSVPGCGPVDARCLLVGEAPGAEEDRQGLPFVGRAGALLNQMLAAVGLDRERDVYVTNALKCRPPGNRNPEPDESMRCRPFLQRQVELLSPGLAVLMGRYAAQSILQSDASIASLRGLVHRATVGTATVRCIVTYHPAYLLRNPQDKAKAWRDWALVRRTLETTAETSA